jgi:hypothetical protein
MYNYLCLLLFLLFFVTHFPFFYSPKCKALLLNVLAYSSLLSQKLNRTMFGSMCAEKTSVSGDDGTG